MKISILGVFILLLAGCNNAPQTTEEHDHSGHEHQESTTMVALNNGEKWEANPETTEGINNMLVLIEDFEEENGDYDQLREDLQNEFKMIFQKCTMKGEAHDQLHNYLLPLKAKIANPSHDNLDDITAYLRTYPNYFQ